MIDTTTVHEYTYIVGIYPLPFHIATSKNKFGMDVFLEITKDQINKYTTYDIAKDLDIKDFNKSELYKDVNCLSSSLSAIKIRKHIHNFETCVFHSDFQITRECMEVYINSLDYDDIKSRIINL